MTTSVVDDDNDDDDDDDFTYNDETAITIASHTWIKV